MATPSRTKSHFEQLSCDIYARRPRENYKKLCIDCLKPRSKENKAECKNCSCTQFYVLDYQNSSFEILSSL